MSDEKLSDLCERLKMEAQIHAQEARTANATIAEIYQIVTGATGEPGNWNGAGPVRAALSRLRDTQRVLVEALRKIAAPGFGIEIGDSYEVQAEYWSDVAERGRAIARAALASVEQQEPSEDARDALRYRWLCLMAWGVPRGDLGQMWHELTFRSFGVEKWSGTTKEVADAAIDAAMSTEPKP